MAEKILLIEDHPETIDIYKTLFKKEGFNLEIIDSGKRAKEKIENLKEKPSLILLDLMLPEVNGVELLQIIRNNSDTNNIPVIIFTNYTDPEQKEGIEKLGVEKFIIKTDQTPLEFVELIKDWFKNQKK